ncbi:MAG: HEPN domain-containing protein [Thermoguttaceae bacterium]
MQDNDRSAVIQNWIEKSDRALCDVKYCVANGQLEAAQNRLYYAIFYVVKALSIREKFATSKHGQLLGWFNKNYVHTNIVEEGISKIYKVTFDLRCESDYGVEFQPTKEQLTKHFCEAEVFIAEVKKLLAEE